MRVVARNLLVLCGVAIAAVVLSEKYLGTEASWIAVAIFSVVALVVVARSIDWKGRPPE